MSDKHYPITDEGAPFTVFLFRDGCPGRSVGQGDNLYEATRISDQHIRYLDRKGVMGGTIITHYGAIPVASYLSSEVVREFNAAMTRQEEEEE